MFHAAETFLLSVEVLLRASKDVVVSFRVTNITCRRFDNDATMTAMFCYCWTKRAEAVDDSFFSFLLSFSVCHL